MGALAKSLKLKVSLNIQDMYIFAGFYPVLDCLLFFFIF